MKGNFDCMKTEKSIRYISNLGGYDMYRIHICDDEENTCEQLFLMIEEYGKKQELNFEISVWYNGKTLCDHINSGEKIDLLFLDIELLDSNGIAVGKYIRDSLGDLRTVIVFVSHKSQYAMDLFQIQPLDFLLKPLTYCKVTEVLDIWQRRCLISNQTFEVKVGRNYHKIFFSDIYYLYSNNRKVIVVTNSGELEFYGKLKEIFQIVPDNFIMIHKSYVVNQDYIKEWSYESVKMFDEKELAISQAYRKDVRAKLIKMYKEKRDV
ncbi:MAG: LytTR family DNA-binding domain-containing protein [Bacillota bacterium]|nr:LytTR family DNA-binding domain-containing protein [Bacillota bacterium]